MELIRKKLIPLLLLTAGGVYAGFLGIVSLAPIAPDSAVAAGAARRAFNNLLHIPAYGVLTFIVWLALNRLLRRTIDIFTWPAVIAFAYGGLLEALQKFYIPGRDGNMLDLGLNGTGILLTTVAIRYFTRRRPKEMEKPVPHPTVKEQCRN